MYFYTYFKKKKRQVIFKKGNLPSYFQGTEF